MQKHYDLIGVGIGLFNLSLAALADKHANLSSVFFDKKKNFEWHSEIIFPDSEMQTSFLKDLVMGADPTSPHSFLNYLVQKGLFYSFLNTNRQVVTRREFEMYCQWVSENLKERLHFDEAIEEVKYDGDQFLVKTSHSDFVCRNLCLATGLTPYIPAFAQDYLGDQVFHAKSATLKNLKAEGKRVVVVGGGQTGLEIFRNGFKGRWGNPRGVTLISSRANLEPLDNSPFVNEYFTPRYVNEFFQLEPNRKDPVVKYQKLASDGNTPEYLHLLYNDLYQLKHVQQSPMGIELKPHRRLTKIQKEGGEYHLTVNNSFTEKVESLVADVVILSTGFRNLIPAILEPLLPQIPLDPSGRFMMNRDFTVQWAGAEKNKIFAFNFSRHGHGISEPQTSLMAWRSGVVLNSLLGEEFYRQKQIVPNFVNYGMDPL